MRKKVSLIVAFAMLGVAVLGGLGIGIWYMNKDKTPDTASTTPALSENLTSEQALEVMSAFCDYYNVKMARYLMNAEIGFIESGGPELPEMVCDASTPSNEISLYSECNILYSMMNRGIIKWGETTFVDFYKNGDTSPEKSYFISLKTDKKYVYIDVYYGGSSDYSMTSYLLDYDFENQILNKIEVYKYDSGSIKNTAEFGYVDIKNDKAVYLGLSLKDTSTKTIKDVYFDIKTRQVNLDYIKQNISGIVFDNTTIDGYVNGLVWDPLGNEFTRCNTCVDENGNFFEDVSEYESVGSTDGYDFTPQEQTKCLQFLSSVSIKSYDETFKAIDYFTGSDLKFGKYVDPFF